MQNDPPLGRLERVNLRTIWPSEPQDFTPWLAETNNIKLLGDAIDLELEVEAQEKGVGRFQADILCKASEFTDRWVLIENQLERTDHIHLGQLITYAAGLEAVTVVWIAERFTEEHRAALDWLNEIVSTEVQFFAIEIELWRIGSSLAAPKFNVVSKPNDWTKSVSSELELIQSETKKLQLKYWEALREFMAGKNGAVRARKPAPQHWQDFAIGHSDFNISAVVDTRLKTASVRLIVSGDMAKEHFRLLHKQKDEIEQEISETLEWRELPNNKQSQINLSKPGFDLLENSTWDAQIQWHFNSLERFHKTFSSRVQELDVSNDIDGIE